MYTIMLLSPGFYQANKTFVKGAIADFLILSYSFDNEWDINQSKMTYGFFRTVFDRNGNALADYSVYGTVGKTCAENALIELYYDRVCVTLFIY